MKVIYICVLLLTLFVSSAFADETNEKSKRQPTGVDVVVSRIEGTRASFAEKWVDRTTGVVCYAVGGEGKGISCIKVTNPW